ncbi:hypothetical protein LINPERPRIM_LOCUS3058 [Linum perenne]
MSDMDMRWLLLP